MPRAEAHFARYGPVHFGVLVDDIRADSNMRRHWQALFNTGCKQTVFPERMLMIDDPSTYGLPEAKIFIQACLERLIHASTGLIRKTEITGMQHLANFFRGCTNQRDFEIVNSRRTVHGHSRDNIGID